MSNNSNHLNSSNSPSNDLNAAELLARLQNGEQLTLLDVREPIEYHTYNIGGANIPLSQLAGTIDRLDLGRQQEIIVVCKVGLRSETAQSILQQLGYTNVKNLEGGLLAVQRLQQQTSTKNNGN